MSALVFGGNPRKVFEYVGDNAVSLVVSLQLLEEIRGIIRDKFSQFEEDFELLLFALRKHLIWVSPPVSVPSLSRDPGDDFLLAMAANCNAKCIVSGDNDLLSLKEFNDIWIISPAQFLERWHSLVSP